MNFRTLKSYSEIAPVQMSQAQSAPLKLVPKAKAFKPMPKIFHVFRDSPNGRFRLHRLEVDFGNGRIPGEYELTTAPVTFFDSDLCLVAYPAENEGQFSGVYSLGGAQEHEREDN